MAEDKPILVVTQIPPNANLVVNNQLPTTVLIAAPLGPGIAGGQGPQGQQGATGVGFGYTAIGLSGSNLWVSTLSNTGVRGESYSLGRVQ
jgi:hypothetical protein